MSTVQVAVEPDREAATIAVSVWLTPPRASNVVACDSHRSDVALETADLIVIVSLNSNSPVKVLKPAAGASAAWVTGLKAPAFGSS
jgi:hypothetical protein